MDGAKKRWMLAAVTLLFCSVHAAAADAPPEPPAGPAAENPPCLIAEIDMGKVFQHYEDFKQKQDELKLEVKRVDTEIRTAKKGIMELKRRSIDLPAGSEQETAMNRAIESLTEGVKKRIESAKKSLMDREAALYWECYQQVERTVAAYARNHQIRMVVRKQTPPEDETNREQILKAVQRFIVFADNCDITDEIIAALNE